MSTIQDKDKRLYTPEKEENLMKSTIEVKDFAEDNLIKTQRNTPNPDLAPNYNRP